MKILLMEIYIKFIQLNIIVNDKIYSFELNKNDCRSLVNLGLIKLKEGINKIEIINSYGFSFTYFETPRAKVVKRKELNLDLSYIKMNSNILKNQLLLKMVIIMKTIEILF